MARIRRIDIKNFRAIKELSWLPSAGTNCLIGPGDSGKSSLLDAVDLCLGARRNVQITDADFHKLDVETPIEISITIGELDDVLKSIDAYGMFFRGFDSATGLVEDEPEKIPRLCLPCGSPLRATSSQFGHLCLRELLPRT